MYVTGYALVDSKGLAVPSTVAATIRGAQVNAIVSVYGHMVYNDYTDNEIKHKWEMHKRLGDRIMAVKIEVLGLGVE